MTQMNPRFFTQVDTHRVILSDDQWVDIKKEMSLADWDKFEAASVTVMPGQTKDADVQATFHRSNITLLEINIIAWSFDVMVTRNNIGKLNRATSDAIVKAIDALNVTPKEAEELKARGKTN